MYFTLVVVVVVAVLFALWVIEGYQHYRAGVRNERRRVTDIREFKIEKPHGR